MIARVLALLLIYSVAVAEESMSAERLAEILKTHPEAQRIDDVIALLPDAFLGSFVLKHGVKRGGARGHLVERKVSQSADPQLPRVILFDARSGFGLSYNGGGAQQKAAHRFDLIGFDFARRAFTLSEVSLPAAVGASDCQSCHGPDDRPIFAMYPDWPSFYGSDNDELTADNPAQKAEMADYRKFRDEVAAKHPRYAPLYSNERSKKQLGRELYASYPERPDTDEKPRAVSRAFAFRPALRMGILYNRLNAQHVEARMEKHARYDEFAPYFLFNLLQCGWSKEHDAARAVWLAKVKDALKQEPVVFADGGLDYRQNWALFDLSLADVDIRYSYNHGGYANTDATDKPMEVGTIGRYFNAYFDGSATVDELVAGRLYENLGKKIPGLVKDVQLWGLVAKYQHLKDRFRYDEAFFRQMDALGKWIHIPYPKQLAAVHHRESFTPAFARTHKELCESLQQVLAN
jgi:hypothetical protein